MNQRKGILLAGGSATRLRPATSVISKQLLPVYDKPMVYYPLTTLMLAGIREILVISTPFDLPLYERLLGDGSQIGIKLQYKVQPRPEGLAQAFILAEDFLAGAPSALVLGDNIFYGHGLPEFLREAGNSTSGATVFGYWVNDPERYGVVEFDASGNVLSMEEKPQKAKSNYAVVGLYFYDGNAPKYAAALTPSLRGELEITELNNVYLRRQELKVSKMGRGFAWLDTGTFESLLQAANFIQAIEERQGLKVGSLEETAFRMGFIDRSHLLTCSKAYPNSPYGAYLERLATTPDL
jgi:glucose-1-phosphate thymidylyltransferase